MPGSTTVEHSWNGGFNCCSSHLAGGLTNDLRMQMFRKKIIWPGRIGPKMIKHGGVSTNRREYRPFSPAEFPRRRCARNLRGFRRLDLHWLVGEREPITSVQYSEMGWGGAFSMARRQNAWTCLFRKVEHHFPCYNCCLWPHIWIFPLFFGETEGWICWPIKKLLRSVATAAQWPKGYLGCLEAILDCQVIMNDRSVKPFKNWSYSMISF